MDYPKISIVIPLRHGGSAARALSSLKEADYPAELIETFVIEGNNPSRQRNQAIKNSSGQIIFFFDDDSCVNPALFKNAVATYRSYPDAVGVGGPAYLYGRTFFQQATIIIMSSILGVFKIRARYKAIGKIRYTSEDELISCNLSIKKEAFTDEFGFNEKLYPNEENELISRLQKKGRRFIYNPDCMVTRRTDDNLKVFLRRIFCYGRGRIEQFFVSQSALSLLRLLPFLFFGSLSILFFINRPIFKLFFYPYIAIVLAFSIYNSRHKLKLFPLVVLLYIATHLAYACGEASAMAKILISKRKHN